MDVLTKQIQPMYTMSIHCDPIVIEAKRVILQEQLDKISNLELSHIKANSLTADDEEKEENDQEQMSSFHKQKLLLNCFKKWRNIVQQKQMHVVINAPINQKDKIEMFIENLKNVKSNLPQDTKMVINKPIDCKNKLNALEIKQKPTFLRQGSLEICPTQPKPEIKKRYVKTAIEERMKNRFEAQKSIIEKQKHKLEEQERIIQELKFGKISVDLYKSVENAQHNIRDIFSTASVKVKCKINPIASIGCSEQQFELSSCKAPKFVQEMEKRAQERAAKREVILERKRLMDEHKRKLNEQAIEAKRAQDEEETKRNLEAIKERRRKELEIEKRRQMNRQKMEHKYRMAEKFYNDKLKKRYFNTWINVVVYIHNMEEKCDRMYVISLLKMAFQKWTLLYESVIDEKNMIADYLFKRKVFKRVFAIWKMKVVHSKQELQVAQDFSDMKLESCIFKHWHRYVCTQYILELRHIQIADAHYKRRILFQYFYQWKSLPAVLQLERAKEEKKKRWREMVWEILPDYQPPTDI